MTELKRTPLYDRHVALGGRLIDFGGWALPVQYDGILAEHHRTRREVSLFDTCHMGLMFVEGVEALEGLSRLVTQDIRTLADGRCRYGFLLNSSGGVLDDLIVYRFSTERWMLVVNAGTQDHDYAWVREHLPTGVVVKHMAGVMGKLDLQGPRSPLLLDLLFPGVAANLRRFSFTTAGYRGQTVVISRTGYTGETGFELYADTEMILSMWDYWIAQGVRPAGLGARDTLRLEAGLPLYGHELTEQMTPLEAGMERYALKKESFIGKEALEEKKRKGVEYTLVGFRVEGRQAARSGHRVLSGESDQGWVTSGSFSPTLECVLGMAYVRPQVAGSGTHFSIQTERKSLAATCVSMPFYRKVEPK